MVWIGRLLGFREISQVSGIESVETLCRAGVDLGWRHYFIGGGPGVAQGLAAEMQARVPGLVVAGVETPPFRKMTEREASEMRQRIRSSNAQIVWVGLSTPKQELWMSENAPHLPGTISFGVGAGFDVNIGSIPRAPRALRVVGLEWLYRLLKEPKRLSRRYTEVVPRFALLALKRLVNFG
jgi:N-acetylglucosaminyldiphosphoundecaprenol N-acetyl-beta-D-mannosaminyltransferase